MSLNPPPTIEAKLCLITQSLQRSDMTRPALLTFGFASALTPSQANAVVEANKFQTAFNSRIAPVVDSEVTISQPVIRMGDGSAFPFEAVATGAAIVGGNATNMVPPNVAVLVKKNTGVSGRKNRGRSFFPFILDQSNCNENGSIVPAYIAAVQPRFTGLLGDLDALNLNMSVPNKTLSSPTKPHYVTHIATGNFVTSWLIETMIATQRRRLGR